jgi:transketolase
VVVWRRAIGHASYLTAERCAALGSGRIGTVGEDLEYLRRAGRPADANETVEAWKIAVAHSEGAGGAGAYAPEVAQFGPQYAGSRCGNGKTSLCPCRLRRRSAQTLLIATGSEVSIRTRRTTN